MATTMANRGVRSWTALSVAAILGCGTPLGAQGGGQTTVKGLLLPSVGQTLTPQGSQTAPPAGQTATPANPMAAQGGPVLQLTMEQAVAMAVESNLSLKAARLNVDIAAEGVAGAQAVFKPTLSLSTSTSTNSSLASSVTDLTSGTISSSSLNDGVTVNQLMPWFGGNYTASWTNSRSTTTRTAPSFNPQLQSNVSFSYTQPLLRNFLIDPNRAALENSQTAQQVANLDIQLNTITLQNSVRQAYLQLIAANEQLKVSMQNLDLANQTLTSNQARVKVGVAAQADIITSEVAVKQNQQQLIQARGNVAASEDQLRSLILDPSRPDYWTVHLDTTDSIVVQSRDIDVDASVKSALANRLDLQEARRNLEIAHRTTRLDETLTKPSLNAIAQYSATSSGGTVFTYDGFTTTPISQTTKPFSSVLSDTFTGAVPSWAVGVTLGYPIGRTTAEANLAQQRLAEQQAQINLRNQELQVAAQIRQAARDVKTNYEVVQAAHAALDAAQQQLDAENRKQEVGLSDQFTLLQKVQTLTGARINAVSAEINYNFALLAFDRLQKVR
jgi:outer membrane protein